MKNCTVLQVSNRNMNILQEKKIPITQSNSGACPFAPHFLYIFQQENEQKYDKETTSINNDYNDWNFHDLQTWICSITLFVCNNDPAPALWMEFFWEKNSLVDRKEINIHYGLWYPAWRSQRPSVNASDWNVSFEKCNLFSYVASR